jgi:hypothetical protein
VLKTLADETGGRSFFVKEADELGPIYAAIQQELRSRYLLAYQSTNTERGLKFRTIEVRSTAPASRRRRCAATTRDPARARAGRPA